jgi:hypothetical protein
MIVATGLSAEDLRSTEVLLPDHTNNSLFYQVLVKLALRLVQPSFESLSKKIFVLANGGSSDIDVGLDWGCRLFRLFPFFLPRFIWLHIVRQLFYQLLCPLTTSYRRRLL